MDKKTWEEIGCPGWSYEDYYISDYFKKNLINAKVVKVEGGFKNKYHGKIYFDNNMILCWHEDSEEPGVWLDD